MSELPSKKNKNTSKNKDTFIDFNSPVRLPGILVWEWAKFLIDNFSLVTDSVGINILENIWLLPDFNLLAAYRVTLLISTHLS